MFTCMCFPPCSDIAPHRDKIFRDLPDGYQTEVGAMRIPTHQRFVNFLIEKFNLEMSPFYNTSADNYFYIRGKKVGDQICMNRKSRVEDSFSLGVIVWLSHKTFRFFSSLRKGNWTRKTWISWKINLVSPTRRQRKTHEKCITRYSINISS